MPATEIQLSNGNAEVHFDAYGSGPALLLIHGTAATREQWLPLADTVADRFTVIAPDYSGSGDTVDHGGPVTLDDLAAEMLAAADAAGAGRIHLVGHSLGAVIATHIAAQQPERIESLALHAGWAVTDTRLDAEFAYWLELLRADQENGTSHFARMLPLMAFGPRYWESTDSAGNEQLVEQLAGGAYSGAIRQTEVNRTVDLRSSLGRIIAPTLVLASKHDRIIGADQQQLLLKGIANARYAEIDAGHGAPAEDSDGFIAKVAAFLDEQVAATVLTL